MASCGLYTKYQMSEIGLIGHRNPTCSTHSKHVTLSSISTPRRLTFISPLITKYNKKKKKKDRGTSAVSCHIMICAASIVRIALIRDTKKCGVPAVYILTSYAYPSVYSRKKRKESSVIVHFTLPRSSRRKCKEDHPINVCA